MTMMIIIVINTMIFVVICVIVIIIITLTLVINLHITDIFILLTILDWLSISRWKTFLKHILVSRRSIV